MKKSILTTTFIAGLVLLGISTTNAKADTITDTQSNQAVATPQNNNSSIYVDDTVEHPRLKNVNGYINQNHLQFSGIKDESAQSTFTAGKNYRHGAPEGIVVHETNKPNISAQEWADKFNENWKSNQTYVHAFVDKSQVVQIAPTNKTVWGSGYYGNQRFIQVELCEENTEQDFAQSIQNDATYIAKLLHQYNLKPSLADGKGNGTIWSHHDVSKYLGDTDHTDPDGYFAWHNYSMQQFFNLIKQRYDELAPLYSQNNVIDEKGVGQVRYNGKGKVAIWYTPNSGHKIVKYVSRNTKWKFFKVAKINGHLWYNLGGNQWIDGTYFIKK
ncbi:N-acetylmuramoyl-L-alanine amidase family protein [Lactobacillus sp. PV034]|uniref:peptidoglycan recognition protein family protein n=1 Tax=Lactobacillus sp. PV034 TaxID=2594495 RepID=UPI00223FD5E7|nr:peptidoglycan recognition family protein [Lactobacillus sp. PV034]